VKRFLLITVLAFCTWSGGLSDAYAAEQHLIAVIMAGPTPRHLEIQAAFNKELKSFCAEDCRIYVQKPNSDIMSLRNSVRKAVALGADLILTYGSVATLAAKAETPPMPTLFVDVYDPVGLELVSPKTLIGRNMTGVRGDAPVQALLKYFLDVTKAKKLAVLFDLYNPEGVLQKSTFESSARSRKVDVVSIPVDRKNDYSLSIGNAPEDIDGIFLANGDEKDSSLDSVLDFATECRVPVITQRPGFAEKGAFMVLETEAEEQGRELARMTRQVLSGNSVNKTPMVRPHNVDFVINLIKARAYGIKVPFETLSVASRIVR
jgi:putative ABC transport system substrate-binding protein